MPYVEYTRIDDEEVCIPKDEVKTTSQSVAIKQTVSIPPPPVSVNKAKKSTTVISSKNQQLIEPQIVKPSFEGSQGKVIVSILINIHGIPFLNYINIIFTCYSKIHTF